MASPVRVALIGCGRIAPRHIAAIDANADASLAAVCDLRGPQRVKTAAEAMVVSYGDWREMLRREKPDVAAVLTESGTHAAIAVAVAPHVGALIIEKPMALTLSDADSIIEACDRAGTRLFVVKQNRYNAAIVKLHEALCAGRFGKLVLGSVRVRWCRRQSYYDADAWRGTWQDDGGVFANQASHHLDLLQWLMGPVESVMAYTATRLVNIEADDTGVASLRFLNGALGLIEATTATRPRDLEGSISILGEHGVVVVGGFAANEIVTWQFEIEETSDAQIRALHVKPPNVYGYGHEAFYADVVRALRAGRPSMLEGIEGRKAVELMNAIYESATTGTQVRLHYAPRSTPFQALQGCAHVGGKSP